MNNEQIKKMKTMFGTLNKQEQNNHIVDMEQLKQKCYNLELQLSSKQKQCDNYESENKELKRQLNDATQIRIKLENDVELKNKKIQMTEINNLNIQNQYNSLMLVKTNNDTQIFELKQNMNHLQKEHIKDLQIIEETQKKIQQLECDNISIKNKSDENMKDIKDEYEKKLIYHKVENENQIQKIQDECEDRLDELKQKYKNKYEAIIIKDDNETTNNIVSVVTKRIKKIIYPTISMVLQKIHIV